MGWLFPGATPRIWPSQNGLSWCGSCSVHPWGAGTCWVTPSNSLPIPLNSDWAQNLQKKEVNGLLIENFTFNRKYETAREDWGWAEFFLQKKVKWAFSSEKNYIQSKIIPDFQGKITKKQDQIVGKMWKFSHFLPFPCPSLPTKIKTASK